MLNYSQNTNHNEDRKIAKKKLLLILPRNERGYWGKVSKKGKAGFVRLSLPTIAALTPTNWDIEILDSRAKSVDYNLKCDLVAITGFTAEMPSAFKIADGFRAKGVKVVMGGIHVSALPDEALMHADCVVIGEAELTWKSLISDFEKGDLKPTYTSDTKTDMSCMAIPKRDLLNRKMYVSGFNTIQATRGCPFACSYCAVSTFFGNKIRTRPIEDVINEIKTFDTNDLFFIDDNITAKPKYAKELFKAMIPLNKSWGGQTDINIAKDEELLSLYSKAGGKYVFIGFETLSKKNLSKMNKTWNSPDGYKEAIKRIHKAGINILGSFIFGLEEDDKTVFKNTLDFISEHNIDAAQFHILTPFPGTKLYENYKSEGRITDSDWAKYHTGEVIFKHKNMTKKELQEGYWWAFRETYTFKNILKRVFRSPRNLPTRLGMNFSYRKKSLRMPKVNIY